MLLAWPAPIGEVLAVTPDREQPSAPGVAGNLPTPYQCARTCIVNACTCVPDSPQVLLASRLNQAAGPRPRRMPIR